MGSFASLRFSVATAWIVVIISCSHTAISCKVFDGTKKSSLSWKMNAFISNSIFSIDRVVQSKCISSRVTLVGLTVTNISIRWVIITLMYLILNG
jgi:hypothetical protein